MVMSIAERVHRAHYAIRDPYMANVVREVKASGKFKTIYEFNIGDPGALRGRYGFGVPKYIREELKRVIDSGKYDGYAHEQGEPEVREAIAQDSQRRGIRDAKAENVVVGNGLSELIDYLFGVTLVAGKNVVVPKPDYPLYTARGKWYGAQIRHYDLMPDRNWEPNMKQLEGAIDRNTAWVVVIHPNNPTGKIFSEGTLRQIVDVVERKGRGEVPIMSDEIYHRLRFDGKAHPALAALTTKVPVVTMDGFSKGFYAPGWRLGHVLFSNFHSSDIRDALIKVCAFRLSGNQGLQMAYAHALDNLRDYEQEKHDNLQKLAGRVRFSARMFNSTRGIKVNEPEGAFYMMPRVTEGPWKTDVEFAERLLREEGVRVVPGSGFGMKPEDRFFRIVPLASEKYQAGAILRIRNFMQRHLGKQV